jgi:hypothetical protein
VFIIAPSEGSASTERNTDGSASPVVSTKTTVDVECDDDAEVSTSSIAR